MIKDTTDKIYDLNVLGRCTEDVSLSVDQAVSLIYKISEIGSFTINHSVYTLGDMFFAKIEYGYIVIQCHNDIFMVKITNLVKFKEMIILDIIKTTFHSQYINSELSVRSIPSI